MLGHVDGNRETELESKVSREESEELLLSLLLRASIRAQAILDRKFIETGITAQEAALLVQCAEGSQKTAAKLARSMNRDKGGVTRLLSRLQARELIRRVPSAGDRRAWIIQTTRKGQVLAPQCKKLLRETRALLFAEFLDGELDHFSEELLRLCGSIHVSEGPKKENLA